MKALALRGRSNIGKSKTLKTLIQTLCESKQPLAFGLLYPRDKNDDTKDLTDTTMCAKNAPLFHGDVYAVFELDGVCVGISTQEDNRKWLDKAYEQICDSTRNATTKTEPDIFICAIRSYGDTNNFVINICDYPPIIVYDKLSINSIGTNHIFNEMTNEQASLNYIQAQILFDYLSKVISCGG